MIRILSLVLLCFVLAAPALAAEDNWHPSLKKFEEDGGTVEFLGRAYGMDGWIIMTKEGDVKYVYTNDQGALVLGVLIGADGKVKTAEQLIAYKARKSGSQAALPGALEGADVPKVEKVYAGVEKSNWVAIGRADAPYIYIFINVTCEHCHALWNDLVPAVRAGNLQVRLVPFGKLTQNLEGGAALLSSDNPEQAWVKFLAGDKAALSKEMIRPGAIEKIAENSKFVAAEKFQGPPFTIYRRPHDGKIQVVVGRPKNAMLMIADLMRQPSDAAASQQQEGRA